ncbi:MAG TPA: LytTR family DNA-binding domain-containing protein [Longimicrobium sp.]|nr:LytTR family DNA-binding domain-containing protein [Longimicrobium sp.]
MALAEKTPGRTSALIVDDEPLARQRIRELLAGAPWIEIAGECSTGTTAVEAIREVEPGLVFLDVQMPGMNGFDVVRALGPDATPHIIFVTAYDEFAIQAFDANAVDYLLKPFPDERFWTAMDRARLRLRESAPLDPRLFDWLEHHLPARPRQYPSRVPVKVQDRYVFIPVDDIERVESADNYISLHAGTRTYMVRDTLTRFAENLDPARFMRVRNSTALNVDKVQSVRAWSGTQYEITLVSGTVVLSSRAYRANVHALIGKRGDAGAEP